MSGEIDLNTLRSVLGTEYKIIMDADRQGWAYRRVNSMLERRSVMTTDWREVTGEDFRRMTPDELRHVAAVLEGKGDLLDGKWTAIVEKEKP